MPAAAFTTLELCADGSFARAGFALAGDPEHGWRMQRAGAPWLEVGPGYRLLRTLACGVCATDLARPHLPFRLPQVVGHEVVAVDDAGMRHVIEINASHRARGMPDGCAFCTAGIDHHCPDRLVLGIHDLPGGFGPWVLAPVAATIAVPDELPTASAVLIEPFAAALHAVTTVAPRAGDRVAVLGPRRLGMLVIAACKADARRRGVDVEVVALARRRELLDLAREVGADSAIDVGDAAPALPDGFADIVIDTTGNPDAFEHGLRLARRELHLKSTHGRTAAGVRHLTEMVVDELALAPFDPDRPPTGPVAWLAGGAPVDPSWHTGSAVELARAAETMTPIPRFAAAVVEDEVGVDAAVRPRADREVSLVRPGGQIAIRAPRRPSGPLVTAVTGRGLRVSTSRCGDFRSALALMAADPDLAGLGDRLITHRFGANDLASAFATAAGTTCIKAVVEHDQH